MSPYFSAIRPDVGRRATGRPGEEGTDDGGSGGDNFLLRATHPEEEKESLAAPTNDETVLGPLTA